jgi:hypothetical protein
VRQTCNRCLCASPQALFRHSALVLPLSEGSAVYRVDINVGSDPGRVQIRRHTYLKSLCNPTSISLWFLLERNQSKGCRDKLVVCCSDPLAMNRKLSATGSERRR